MTKLNGIYLRCKNEKMRIGTTAGRSLLVYWNCKRIEPSDTNEIEQ